MGKRWLVVAGGAGVAACCLIASGAPVRADSGDKRVRLNLAYSSPTDDHVTGEFDDSPGLEAGFEYMVSDLLGAELAVAYTDFEGDFVFAAPLSESAEIALFTAVINVNFHVLQHDDFNLSIGPTLGYAFWDDLDFDTFAGPFEIDDEFVYGFNLGIDVPFGSSDWGFNGALGYLFMDAAAVAVDPILIKAGVAYRF